MFSKTKITNKAIYLLNMFRKKINQKDNMLFILDEYELKM